MLTMSLFTHQILNKERKVLQLDTELANVTQSLAHKTKEVTSWLSCCYLGYYEDIINYDEDKILWNRARGSLV